MSWNAEFVPPVPLPEGGTLDNLDQARAYALKLPNAVSGAPAWQTAIEAMLLVGGGGGPADFARIGLMQALYPKGEPVYDKSRKEPKWRRARLARDQ